MQRGHQGTRRGTILVVDDDKDVRRELSELLIDEGFDVKCVPDGVAALHYLAASPTPHVVLLDLNLPGRDGYEFLERRANELRMTSISVIVVSGTTYLHRIPFPGTFSLTAILRNPLYSAALFDVLRQTL